MTEETQPTGETPETPAQATSEAVSQPAEEFDKDRAMATIHNLREIEKKAKADAKELEALRAEKQKRAEAEMTEAQRLQKQLQDATELNARLTLDMLRRDVIAETGLPAAFAERLKGTSKDELLADAKELLKVIPQPPQKQAPALNPTNPAGGASETEAQQRERLFGKQSNLFDPATIRQQGGGVIWNK